MKRLIAFMLITMLATVSIIGCTQPSAETGQMPKEDMMEKEETSMPSAKNVVKIGFLGPITGPNSAEGAAARNAFELAIKQANESGEFPDLLETLIIDDQSDASVAVAGAQKIVADPEVVCATGHWNSGPAEATIPVFKEAEIPMLIWGAIRESLTSAENYPWITRSAPTDVQENVPLAKAVLDDMGYDKVFIISDVTSYGEGNTAAFQAELASRGLKEVGLEKVQEGTVDFRAIIEKVKSSGANCVYWGGVVTEGSILKQQLFEDKTNVLFCAISGTYSDDFLKIGAEAAEGALVVKPGIVLNSSDVGRKFVEEYNAANYSEPIGAYTPYAYEAALILLNAFRACGDMPTPGKMVDAIRNSETTGIMGTTKFNDIGQTTNVAAYLNVVQDGAWTVYDDSEYAGGGRMFAGK